MSRLALALALPVLVASCTEHLPRPQPRETFHKGEQWTNAPAWAKSSLRQQWWTSFGDPQLNGHITTSLSHNADLRVLGARLQQARAQTRRARAATWPSINVGTGLVFGNEQTRMTGLRPTDLEPWASSGTASWEIDLFGKLGAAVRSSRESEQTAFWDLHAGRLLVATQVADAHFRIIRLEDEHDIISDSVAANEKIVTTLKERAKAGLISTTELRRQEAEHQRLIRSRLDTDRLRGLARIQLGTLLGKGTAPSLPGMKPLAAIRVPELPARATSTVMAKRPDLLAAEARVRSAFQLEESARLDLLPSLSLGAGARGESSALISGFHEWMAQMGPRLEIPVYDPARLALVQSRRASTNEAAAVYRRAALQAFEEVESSYLNLANRQRQLTASHREVEALTEARRDTLAVFEKGIVSQIELLESERRHLEGRRKALALRHALLRDHLMLIKALGGP